MKGTGHALALDPPTVREPAEAGLRGLGDLFPTLCGSARVLREGRGFQSAHDRAGA